ncbi:MAG: transporter substrate-binding domain-containing protein [Alphaproteobacteria bacterium]|nr:transporter substrate-binding domain-containing protein [Alphaproteobacteria bacterium]
MKNYFLALLLLILPFPSLASDKLTASERVVSTNILRCGYGGSNPYFKKDPNTGEISGMYIEILQEAAKLLSLKIEWTEEVGYAEFAEGLKIGRYDAFCAPIGILPSRARVSTSAIPLAYNPQFFYTTKEKKLSSNIQDYNKKEIKAVTTDGEGFQILTRKFLPNATEVSNASMTPPANIFMDVVMGKVDVVMHDPVNINMFNKDNAEKGKLIPITDKPTSLSPTTAFSVLPEDTHLLNMMNVAFQTLLDSGKVEEILMKYEVTPDILYRVEPNYKKPN